MDIKISDYVQSYIGPSQNYYVTQERFDSILKYKLGISNDEIAMKNSNEIFEENQNPIEEEKVISGTISKNNPLFESDLINAKTDMLSTVSKNNSDMFNNIDSLTRNQFSSTTPLSKIVSSVAMNGILDTSDVRKKSNYSADFLNEKLKGTPLANMGEHFKRAEDLYGVNAVVLMAMAKLESNYGTSQIARDKNNLFGFQAYDSSPYASAKMYATKQDSIYDAAKHLSKNYLTDGASYFEGYSVDSIGVHYSTDREWASKVKDIASRIVKR